MRVKAMRREDLASGQERAQTRGGVSLAGMWPEGHGSRVESAVGAAHRFQAHSPGYVGDVEHVGSVVDQQRAYGSHELCAVDERQALLRLELHRLEARLGKSRAPGDAAPTYLSLARADQHQGEVGEWRKVSARAYRSARRHHGCDPSIQHLDQ